MVKLDDAVLAKYSRDGHRFEIFVDPYLAWDLKHGKDVNLDNMFAMEEIYSDSAKGKLASEEIIKQVFETTDFLTIAKKIIIDGDVQLTTTQRNEMLKRRENEIIDFIAKNTHDPKEMTPIPPQRIINALDAAKFKFNLSRKRDDELNQVMLVLKKALPISMDKIILSIEVTSQFSGKLLPILHKYDIVEEKWLPSGGLFAKVSLPMGLKQKLITDLNNITRGSVIITVEKQ
ncbi:MAG TPA: ribosome assembly factor SBDS [archaeon]|nr:ribosome assembly factor SBDS [archaeon]HPV65981.1 ribosome assembly factor SBDS [archaeon]